MNHDVPLIKYVKFPARPQALPVRAPDDPGGPEYIVKAELLGETDQGLDLKGITSNGNETRILITLTAPGVIRVLLDAGFDHPQRVRLARPFSGTQPVVSIVKEYHQINLVSDLIKAKIDLEPFKISFYGADDQLLLEQNATDADVVGRSTILPFGYSRVGGRRVAFHDTFTAEPDEHFYGFGEKFTDLDKRGQRLEMWHYDAFGAHSERAYKNVPFFLSTRGYGVFVDSVTQINFDMAYSCHATFSFVVPDSALDYYVIAGPELKTVIQRYAGLVSFPVTPPKWSFGLWISSGYMSDTVEDMLKRARLLRENHIPCDVLHIDPYWMRFGCWSDLEWNKAAFPDPEGMIRQVHELGYRLCLWINPYIGVESPHFAGCVEKGYFLKTPQGEAYVADLWSGDHPPVAILDLTNPEATGWFRERLRAVLRQGVDVFKTDFGEGIPVDAQASNGMTGATLHNLYPLLYNDLVSELTAEETGRSGLVWARSSYAGGQRHAAQWSGDPNSTYPALASTLRGGLSIAMCGHAFWSHDIGGFKGRPTPDLYVRWAQLGAFSPLARAHGTTTRLPWEYGEEACAIFRETMQLRYRLLPYLFSYAIASERDGLPILRPMVLEFPDDPNTYALDLQYFFGREIMVAPIYNQSGHRPVYFPAGVWIDYWSHEQIVGPQTRFIDAPLDKLPLYVRLNALIPTVEPAEHLTDAPFDNVTFDAYLLDRGSFEMNDSDGATNLTAVRRGNQLEIHFSGAKQKLALRLIPLSGLPPVESVIVNGKAISEGKDLPSGDFSSWGDRGLESMRVWLPRPEK